MHTSEATAGWSESQGQVVVPPWEGAARLLVEEAARLVEVEWLLVEEAARLVEVEWEAPALVVRQLGVPCGAALVPHGLPTTL